jgi:hypothetical protein
VDQPSDTAHPLRPGMSVDVDIATDTQASRASTSTAAMD